MDSQITMYLLSLKDRTNYLRNSLEFSFYDNNKTSREIHSKNIYSLRQDYFLLRYTQNQLHIH